MLWLLSHKANKTAWARKAPKKSVVLLCFQQYCNKRRGFIGKYPLGTHITQWCLHLEYTT